jgi:predicted nuclease with TOPRIM domain
MLPQLKNLQERLEAGLLSNTKKVTVQAQLYDISKKIHYSASPTTIPEEIIAENTELLKKREEEEKKYKDRIARQQERINEKIKKRNDLNESITRNMQKLKELEEKIKVEENGEKNGEIILNNNIIKRRLHMQKITSLPEESA